MKLRRSYQENPEMHNCLLLTICPGVKRSIGNLVTINEVANRVGVAAPAMGNSLNYIMQLTSPVMVSAQVSCFAKSTIFGAHGYFNFRMDSQKYKTPRKIREFHTQWMLPEDPEEEMDKVSKK